MLLELYVSDRRPRSLTHLCGAANAPVRTALRMINRMAERDLVTRTADPLDARRVNAALTDSGAQLLDLYFDLLLRSFIVAKVIG
jgi:DNA-binding MarR family transcriptional regulator